MSDRIGSEWRSYRTRVIPITASAIQARECRLAFYAGAAALLRVILAHLEPGEEPTAQDLQTMDEIDAELRAFQLAVRDGLA